MSPQETLQQLLVGRAFSGFRFHTGFSLRFEGRTGTTFVELEGAWFIGSPADWQASLAGFPMQGVEPEEPLQAASLAFLRWNSGGHVISAAVDGTNLVMELEDGWRLTTRADANGDNDWSVYEASGPSVSCEGGVVEVSDS